MTTTPDGRQADAVQSTAVHQLLVAPPGCGKTEVIAMRAEHLIASGVVRDHRRLLAITFSKRARDTMARRIQARLGYARAQRSVTVHNFHGLAARIVRAHGETLGIPPDVLFPTKRWFSDTVSGLTNDWDARERAETLLRELKSDPLDEVELARLVQDSGDEVALRVEEARTAQNRLDYPDLLRHAQRLLRINEIGSLYQAHFDALVLDEFQDLSLQQLEIVSMACVRNAMYVGDPLQGIYSWAGANPREVLAELALRCDRRIDLEISYRSSPEVLKVVNSVAVPLGAVALRAAEGIGWADTGRAYAMTFPDDEAEATAISSLCQHICRVHPIDSIGVIARGGYRRKLIDRALGVCPLPVQAWDMALDTPGVLELLKRSAKGIRKDRSVNDQLDVLQSKALSALNEDDVETASEIHEAIRLLQDKVDDGESVREVLNRFKEVAVTESVPAGVHLLNAHVGKGQQFDWVFVIGLEQGHVPSFKARSAEDTAEEQRVLMVMLSRARKGVIVTRCERTTNRYGLRAQDASPWWAPIEAMCQPVTDNLLEIIENG